MHRTRRGSLSRLRQNAELRCSSNRPTSMGGRLSGKRMVTQALRVMGLGDKAGFGRYSPIERHGFAESRRCFEQSQDDLDQGDLAQWYGDQQRMLQTATGTAVWYHSGIPPVPIRWVLVRDTLGEHEPEAFPSTDLAAAPLYPHVLAATNLARWA